MTGGAAGCVPDGEERRSGIEAFDGYDHGKSLDLAGDAASGYFVAKSGQFPEPGQDLVATKVQLAQPVGFLVDSVFR